MAANIGIVDDYDDVWDDGTIVRGGGNNVENNYHYVWMVVHP